jgi:putative heme-binding domain-containing protein
MPRDVGTAQSSPPATGTAAALELAMKLERGELSREAKEHAVKEGVSSPKETVRDLFERFASNGQAPDRLGPEVDAAKLLALPGDAERGRHVFFGAGGVAAEAGGLCSQCHRVGDDGESFGPDLTQIGAKYTRPQLLEHILEPSKHIDPQFVTYVCRTKKGEDYSGILVEKTADRVVLRDAQKHDAAIPAADVQRLVPQQLSAMPDALLTGLTPQQAADLLEFLATRK